MDVSRNYSLALSVGVSRVAKEACMMSLQEAIEKVTLQQIEWGGDISEDDVLHHDRQAIATILNAVVKGGLK